LGYITTIDNEDNDKIGEPDNDMGKELGDCIDKRDLIHPIGFNINVTGELPVASAYLSVFIEDVDWESGERDEIFLNGHSLCFAVYKNVAEDFKKFIFFCNCCHILFSFIAKILFLHSYVFVINPSCHESEIPPRGVIPC